MEKPGVLKLRQSTIERRNPGGRALGTNRVSARAAVLAAAERLFAARGYEGATIEDIAREAHVSRGTPSYFFGSKRGLYDAVLAAAVDRAQWAIRPAIAAARRRGADDHGVLAAAVDGVVDFVVEDPHFARLVHWRALDGHDPRVFNGHAAPADHMAAVDSPEFIIGLVVLCALPVDRGDSLRRGFGLDWRDPAFLAGRKRHVLELLVSMR